MSNLLSSVTPQTRGLLWFTKDAVTAEKTYYKDVDYLLNGLLTATYKTSESKGSHVLISENFGNTLYVLVGSSLTEKEISNFFELLKPQMKEENNILMIDEGDSFGKVQKLAPEIIRSKIQKL